ncbi:hypothetical protein ACQPXM_02880 [Kribbella sp. CA-253562]|uniref:hypothetical protein n=1 Tax=Kribbella sp. CA-253562 TaxID=3239942 RepID=UPI003D8C7FFA
MPRPVLSTVVGVPVALIAGLGVAPFAPVLLAVSIGVLVGALSAGLADSHAGTQREQLRAVAGELPLPIQLAAYRATRRGPVPDDPEVKAAAVKIARHQLALTPDRNATYPLILLGGGVAPAAIAATTRDNPLTPVLLLLTAMSVLCALTALIQPVLSTKRLRSRLLALQTATDPVAPAADGP